MWGGERKRNIKREKQEEIDAQRDRESEKKQIERERYGDYLALFHNKIASKLSFIVNIIDNIVTAIEDRYLRSSLFAATPPTTTSEVTAS